MHYYSISLRITVEFFTPQNRRKWGTKRRCLLLETSVRTAILCTFIVRGNCLILAEMFSPMTELERHSKCKSPAESKTRNFLWDRAWIETAFVEIDTLAEDFVSTSYPFNATKQAHHSLSSFLTLAFICFTKRKTTNIRCKNEKWKHFPMKLRNKWLGMRFLQQINTIKAIFMLQAKTTFVRQ